MNTHKLKCQRLCFFSCQGCRRSVSSFTPSCLCHVPRHRLTLIPCRLQVSDLFEWIWSVVRPHDVFILLNEKRDAMNFTNGDRRPSTHADSLSFKAFIVLQSFTLIKPTKNKERKLQREMWSLPTGTLSEAHCGIYPDTQLAWKHPASHRTGRSLSTLNLWNMQSCWRSDWRHYLTIL